MEEEFLALYERLKEEANSDMLWIANAAREKLASLEVLKTLFDAHKASLPTAPPPIAATPTAAEDTNPHESAATSPTAP
jgi:hypothetical protein